MTARHLLSLAALAALSATTTLPARAQTAFVSSEKDHKLTVVDLKTQAVTGTIATCKRPRHMVLMP
ncbi:MAG: PQQ-dependent catabolism-associated beta-propeller protein, partial [Sphaerotilus sulfidivorans]